MTERKIELPSSEQLAKTAESFVGLGRKVAGEWLDVGRSVLVATAETLKSTSDALGALSDRMSRNDSRS